MSSIDTLVRPIDLTKVQDTPGDLPEMSFEEARALAEIEISLDLPPYERPVPVLPASPLPSHVHHSTLDEGDIDLRFLAEEVMWGTVNWGVDVMCQALAVGMALSPVRLGVMKQLNRKLIRRIERRGPARS